MVLFKNTLLPTAHSSRHKQLKLCIAALEHKLHFSDVHINFVEGGSACVCFNEHLENGNAVFSPAFLGDCNMVVKLVCASNVASYNLHWNFMFIYFRMYICIKIHKMWCSVRYKYTHTVLKLSALNITWLTLARYIRKKTCSVIHCK